MPNLPNPHRSGPPRNPGLRDLISGKRQWTPPVKEMDAKRGFRGWHERGYLPHRDEPGLTQFVTFRLDDSFPTALRSEWKALFELEDDRERRKQMEQYLDRGRGQCHLQQTEVARTVEEALRFHHGQWYDLQAWVIMPNHVHVLLLVGSTPLAKVIKELKRYSSREVNKLLGASGSFWAEDYFDTYMRDDAHVLRTRLYIEKNPVKALLVQEPARWPWSSARFRDEYGQLRL